MINTELFELTKDIKEAADWLVKAFGEIHIKLDYTLESVKLIDILLDEEYFSREPEPNGFFANDFDKKIFAFGCYIGETIKKNRKKNERKATWILSVRDRENKISIELAAGLLLHLYPVKKVIGRIENGHDDELYSYVLNSSHDYKKKGSRLAVKRNS